MYNCIEPLPDCTNIFTIQNQYISLNKTEADCWLDRTLYIAGRIYLTITIVNGVMVLLTTVLFVYLAITGPANNTLQKRSVMGTVFGAVGHLIFSTCTLITPATNDDMSCELLSWGIIIGFYTWVFAFFIRAYRLKTLFRLNQLKVKYLRMSSYERNTHIKDDDYKWYLKHQKTINSTLMKPYILYIVSMMALLIIFVPIYIVRECSILRGVIVLIVYFATFTVIGVPFLMYYLKDNSDANGIRTEIRIVGFVGLPFFVLYMVFLFLVDPQRHGRYRRMVFLPANWLLFYTVFAHCVTVVLPIIRYLPTSNRYWKKICSWFHYRSKKQKRKNLVPISFTPELTIESLEQCMLNTEMMQQLQDLAIRDFSSENTLFYDRYMDLTQKLSLELTPRNNWINTYIRKKPSIDILTKPVPQKMYPQFIQFYETFIKEDAASQVNISYRARNSIDDMFENVYAIYLSKNSLEKNETSNVIVLTLGIFEAARVEVCWNIFNSVYPKLVSKYS